MRVDTFKLQLKLWCQEPEPMKAHIIDQSLNGYIVMSYYLLPPVNHNQQAYLFFFHNFNDRLWLANQKPNTNSITNPWSVYNVEIANFGCNYLGSTQFIDLKIFGISLYCPSLHACKVLGKSEIWPKIWLECYQNMFKHLHTLFELWRFHCHYRRFISTLSYILFYRISGSNSYIISQLYYFLVSLGLLILWESGLLFYVCMTQLIIC